MFLGELDFVEKEAFISLALHAAEANGAVADEEYQIIEDYCKEVGIVFFDARNTKTMDEIVKIYSESNDRVKKIVVLETIGLMFADGGYDEKEKFFVENLAMKLGLSSDAKNCIEEAIAKYLEVTKELLNCIG
ncbi:MAG: hypothetical protein VZR24_13805 [Butyrivibrio hungatei]|nr:hypothetical protein [Butyrivibrio hungatei]